MCGVVGVIHPNGEHASSDVLRAMLALQHRGQDAAGLVAFERQALRFDIIKDRGLVSQVITPEKLPLGEVALGHTRYPTVGGTGLRDLQPMLLGRPMGVALAHNGNLVNFHRLKQIALRDFHIQLMSDNDLELIMQLWGNFLQQELQKANTPFAMEMAVAATAQTMAMLEGAYAIVGIMADRGLFAFRDPQGIRPLVLGGRRNSKGEMSYALCSETGALDFMGMEYIRDIAPGEFIMIDHQQKIHSTLITKLQKRSHCHFEWIYFSSAESQIEGRSVYGTRLGLGQGLARMIRPMIEQEIIRPDIVVAVPDTGRTASIALAEALGLPYREGLIKNRYIHRSFILPQQHQREEAVERKLIAIRSELEGKNILLVDDSLVRGTSSRKIIQLLKRFGAKEIVLALTCPPIQYPCYYGIDFPDQSELMSYQKSEQEVAAKIGADRVIFLTQDLLKQAIGMEGLCTACLDGNYPSNVACGEEFRRERQKVREDDYVITTIQ
jgi:amidophosphoribosyltransferase